MLTLRERYIALVSWMDDAIPESRQKSLAVTALEESAMWAMKAVSLTTVGGTVVNPPPPA
jgi:hypothetical protein